MTKPDYHIPLNLLTGDKNILGEPDVVRGILTTDRPNIKYGTPVLDVGDDNQYGPSEFVEKFGKTAAELVVEAVLNDRSIAGPMDDAHPDDQNVAKKHQMDGIKRFLMQWPNGPQLEK